MGMRKLLLILLIISFQSEAQTPMSWLRKKASVGGCAYLIDTYSGASAAYSMQRVSCNYEGPAMKVRRTDNTEQDIYYTIDGDLDTADLKTFVGTTALDNGFVVKWYDQSGNANDATQTTALSQPKIMDAGVVVREGIQPSIKYSGAQYLTLTSGLPSNASFSVFGIQARSNLGNILTALSNASADAPFSSLQFNDGNAYFGDGSNYVGGTDGVNGIHLYSSFSNSGTLTFFRNGSSVSGLTSAFSGTTSFNSIGIRGAVYGVGNISEIVYYPSNQTAINSAYVANRTTYYGL